MHRVVLGKTGLEVNRFGFGGIPIQRATEEQAVATVYHAVEKGVDFIDTSRAYTTSERRIGLALKQTNKKVVLASKTRSRTAETARKDLETSLKELQQDYIDIYQCHYVSKDEEYRQIISTGGALEGLIRAKEDKLIGHIGITSHSLDLLDKILDDDLFETIMVCFSFLEPRAEDHVIPKAFEKNVGVIAMKSFSGGVIDNPKLALKYALSYPEIIIIPGVESKALFDQNWDVYQESHELTDQEKQEIEAIRQRYDKNFCRRCDYC
ncbi:aldo/keto reductase, partial [Thermodesulfobacteriota bacterium]